MPKVIVSIDGVVIKEVQLTKDRTTLGRRPYNDIVIDNLAVSGEHAVIQIIDGEAVLEDLNSTNGTYINGKAVKKQSLQNNDTIEIGKYKIRFQSDQAGAGFDKTMVVKPASSASGGPGASMRCRWSPHPDRPPSACSAALLRGVKWPWSKSSRRSANPALRWLPSPSDPMGSSWRTLMARKAPPSMAPPSRPTRSP